MTVGNPAPEVDWRLGVRIVNENGIADGRAQVEKTILEAAGAPMRLREARGRLFILTTSASEGRPALIETEGGLVCVIALKDFVDIMVESGRRWSK